MRTGTLLTVYAPSRSATGGPDGSVDGGLDGESVEEPCGRFKAVGGGEVKVLVPFGFGEAFGDRGVVVGKIFDAIRQKSSKLSVQGPSTSMK